MNWARRRALLLLVLALLAAVVLALALTLFRKSAKPPSERPALLLLTGLPLVFGEDFSLGGAGSPALTALRTRYRVVPISVTAPAELAKGRLMLMAQPFAQPAEDLVALDDWVRQGGQLLLLADPMLEWPSRRPLGDPLRPPAMFMDTGLLAHWGLRLDSPGERGPKLAKIGGYDVLAVSPGLLYGGCQISAERLVAHCRIGKGEATIIADSDLLDVPDLGDEARHNLDAVLSELSALGR